MSGCSCVYFHDDGSGPDCFTRFERKARKNHRCCECGETIRAGESYIEESGVWEGSPSRYRTCLDCISVRESFFCDGFEYGAMWVLLVEHIRCLYGEVSSDCLINLTLSARKSVCELIEESWRE